MSSPLWLSSSCSSHPARPRCWSAVRPCIAVFGLLLLLCKSTAFLQPSGHGNGRLRPTTRRQVADMIVGSPAELSDAIDSGLQSLQHLHIVTAAAAAAAAAHAHTSAAAVAVDSTETAASTSHSLGTMLSTMYVDGRDFYLGPAHGHSNPFFGPPDPHLVTGKSIHPTLPSSQQLLESAGRSGGGGGGVAAPSDLVVAPETLPTESSPSLSARVQAATARGYPILDGGRLVRPPGNALPGFAPTGGILPRHNPNLRTSPQILERQVVWTVGFLNVLDKLPYAAFAYGVVEFFLLRPSVDFFKEDIEEEPWQALQKTVMVTGVRMGVFFVIALITLGIVGL